MNREQCKECVFFKSAGGAPDAIKFCHFMLHTGQRRKVGKDGESCLSRTTHKRRRTRKKAV